MRFRFAAMLAMVALLVGRIQAKESDAAERLDAAADVMTDMMRASDKGIPQD